jgi:alpha-L-fucosidase
MSTPFKRDVLKELADACRDEGIRFCFYHSIMDWHHPDQNRDFPKYREYLFGQVRELLTNYGPIGVMWFDGEWIGQWDAKQGHELNAFCHKLQPEIIVNNRVGKRQRGDGDFGTPEQEIPATGMPGYDWESCMTMNDTWGFKKDDHNWKSTETIIRMLVDCASKGGNLLLNVGPTAEGEIPQPSVERLAVVGQWLKANGDSVYGTRASPFRRLPWGRCTAKPGKLFLHVFSWPNGPLQLPGLDNPIRKAYLLGDEKRSELKLTKTDASLSIALPAEPPDKTDTVIVLEVEGEPRPAAFFLEQAADGTVALKAPDATLHGGTIQCEAGDKDCIGFWTRQDDWVSWDFELAKAGTFTVEVTLACEKGIGGSEYELAIGDQKLAGKVAETGAWSKFVTEKLGTVKLDKPGKHTLSVKAKTKPGMAVMNLRSVVLKPETGT